MAYGVNDSLHRGWWGGAYSTHGLAEELLRSVGRKSLIGAKHWSDLPEWLQVLGELAGGAKRHGEKTIRKRSPLLREAALRCTEHTEDAAAWARALGAQARLGNGAATWAWLEAQLRPPGPKPTPAERAAKVTAARARHAQAKLTDAQRALRRAESRVAKWQAKVRYYQRKGKLPEDE